MSRNKHTTITDAQREARQRNAEKATEARKEAAAARRAQQEAQLEAAGLAPPYVSEARLIAARVELAELELAERRGQLVDAEHSRAAVIEAFSLVKTRLLAVPSRVGQRVPHLAHDVVPVVDELIREALEELADRGSGAGSQ